MPRDLDYAADILAAARLALSYVEGVAYEKFIEDTIRQDAVVRENSLLSERRQAGVRPIQGCSPGHPVAPDDRNARHSGAFLRPCGSGRGMARCDGRPKGAYRCA